MTSTQARLSLEKSLFMAGFGGPKNRVRVSYSLSLTSFPILPGSLFAVSLSPVRKIPKTVALGGLNGVRIVLFWFGCIWKAGYMGSTLSSPSTQENEATYTTPIILNVYDLTPLNNYTYLFGFGIFHSGIEVHGSEYGFGAHDFPTSGIFEVEPKSCPGFIYRCSVSLGTISMPPSEFRAFMENIASEYHGDTYHLMSKNCNHFTDDVCLRLTGRWIPRWVNRLAGLGAMCSCLLPECLQVSAVKQMPEYHVCSEDGSESLSTATRDPTESDDADHDRHLLSPSSGAEVAFIKEVHT